MPAASCPGPGTTRRLMSRGRLGTRKPRGGERRSSGGGAEPGDTAPPARGSAAPCGAASPLDELGQPNIRGPRRRLRARAARQALRRAPPHAPEALSGPGQDRQDPSRRGRLKSPEGASDTVSKARKSPATTAPAKLPKEPRKPEIGAPLPRRERTALRAEEHGA
jgi:hypothetical protein